jgi:hypothetical protein
MEQSMYAAWRLVVGTSRGSDTIPIEMFLELLVLLSRSFDDGDAPDSLQVVVVVDVVDAGGGGVHEVRVTFCKTSTTSQTMEVLAVPVGPRQNMGAGTLT